MKDAGDIHQECAALVEKYLQTSTARCPDKVRQSLDIIFEALKRYKVNEIALSFNGGKDCQVMLVLLLAALSKCERSHEYEFPAVYVRPKDSFPQVDKFVEDCAKKYQLRILVEERGMKNALAAYLKEEPQVRAIFVGIRRQDPYGDSLKYFQRTDEGWPDFERVHPILEWDYGDIWDFLRTLNISYCSLYDQGYTSLGGVNSTIPNPHLQHENGHHPAYMLEDYSHERLGRLSKAVTCPPLESRDITPSVKER